MDYYSLFWVSGLISTIDEPWARLRVILAVLADYGQFHGLLLTILGSRNDVHD